MNKIKIGILKEEKIPVDHRVPLIPKHVEIITNRFSNVEILVKSSNIRCYGDEEYQKYGAKVVDDLSECDILIGVKEVPIENLISEKTYLFFSHTTKKQPYNRKLLYNIINKQIRLIDYEALTDSNDCRVVAFGRYAGIVGAYNGILTYGKRYNLFSLKPAHQCYDLDELINEYEKVSLPNIKIALTGGGRVSKGAMEVLYGMKIRKVSPQEFLNDLFNEPVYCQLNNRDYNKKIDGNLFSRQEFYSNPELYDGDFLKYARVADMLIAGSYWNPASPVLFKKEEASQPDFKIKVIADITCDINGSIPSTKQPSTIKNPIYDYNPTDDTIEAPLKDEGNITVMAVDNLPCELPRDASKDFGEQLINNVLPHLLEKDKEQIIENATITKQGRLTQKYSYLQSYVYEK